MEDTLFRGNREPTLDQILAEPIVQIMMRRDGVREETVRNLMSQAAARNARPPDPPKLNFLRSTPAVSTADNESPRASIGVLARVTEPRWPRVFPSL